MKGFPVVPRVVAPLTKPSALESLLPALPVHSCVSISPYRAACALGQDPWVLGILWRCTGQPLPSCSIGSSYGVIIWSTPQSSLPDRAPERIWACVSFTSLPRAWHSL